MPQFVATALTQIRRAFELPEAKRLLTPYWRRKNQEATIPSVGFCYIATEALFHAIGGLKSDYRPRYAKEGEETHWWLTDGVVILDPTFDQYHPDEPPYQLGKRAGFLNGYEHPSRRARALLSLAGYAVEPQGVITYNH